MSSTNDSPIVVREVNSDEEFNHIFLIRTQVFVEEEALSQEDEYDGFDHLSRHFLAWYEGTPVGTARLRKLPVSGKVRLERFAVLKPYRRRGVGSAILYKLIEEVPPGTEIYVHVQTYNIDFFNRHHFEVDSEVFEEAGVPHVRMVYRET
ncbi:MAG: GNAT family N-acetyltransferase [Bacteroidetes bacterium]|nr:MAG: GNAT family N-acetyltransferase [Bacteroidota bacterium]